MYPKQRQKAVLYQDRRLIHVSCQQSGFFPVAISLCETRSRALAPPLKKKGYAPSAMKVLCSDEPAAKATEARMIQKPTEDLERREPSDLGQC